MKCPNCKKEAVKLKTVIINRKILSGCDNCMTTLRKEADGFAKYNREQQKKEYRRELTQPNQKEFARAYPEKFREMHGDDLYRKLS